MNTEGPQYVKFCAEYRKQLTDAMNTYPTEYGVTSANDPPKPWRGRPTPTQATVAEQTADNMIAAFATNSFNHDSRAFKMTCKALGIRFTRGCINAYLNGDAQPEIARRK